MSSRFSERVFPFHNFIQNKFYAKSYTPFDSAYMKTSGGKIRGLEMARKVVFGNSPIATIVAIFKNFWNSKIATKCRRRHARHEFVSIVNRRLWRHFGADFVTISSQFSSQIHRRCKHALWRNVSVPTFRRNFVAIVNGALLRQPICLFM